MSLSPKQRFLRQKLITENMARMLASVDFEAASDAALLQFQEDLSTATSIEQAAARNYKLEGAKAFLRTLLKIATEETVEKREPIGQLKRV